MKSTKKNIYIYSDRKGSGKTSLLTNWLESRDDAIGILSPKIGNKRYVQNIYSGERRLLDDPKGEIRVGRHRFSEEALTWAEDEFLNQVSQPFSWIIIDEIGPLELNQKRGYYNLLQELLQNERLVDIKILVVVRDSMLTKFLEVFDLPDVELLSVGFFEDQKLPRLHGLILAGGQSIRMQQDKAVLDYHGTEQWRHLSHLLKPITDNQWISINANQLENWAHKEQSNFILDKESFQNNGPLTGLLSAHEELPNQGLLLVGVDYPYINLSDLIQLYNARNENFEAVYFESEGIIQPLICILEATAMQKIKEFYQSGGKSIKDFLAKLQCKKLQPQNEHLFENINTKEAFQKFKMNHG